MKTDPTFGISYYAAKCNEQVDKRMRVKKVILFVFDSRMLTCIVAT